MTDHNDTGATARPWRDTGDRILLPDGRQLIGSVITDPAIRWMIVEAVNAYEPLKARLAEVEAQNVTLGEGIVALCKLTNEDKARIAVLEKALDVAADYIKQCDGGEPANISGWKSEELLEVWLAARTALAEQKEAGK